MPLDCLLLYSERLRRGTVAVALGNERQYVQLSSGQHGVRHVVGEICRATVGSTATRPRCTARMVSSNSSCALSPSTDRRLRRKLQPGAPAYPRMTGQHDDACAGELLMKRFYGENSVHVAKPQIHQDHVRT